MKKMYAAVALLVSFSQANALTIETAPILHELDGVVSSSEGIVIERNQMFPVEEVFVGIPVRINTGSACTAFVGYETKIQSAVDTVTFKGASDAVNTDCIAVMPQPVDAILPVKLFINNHSSNRVTNSSTKVVRIAGKTYRVKYDQSSGDVTITLTTTPRWP